MDIECNIHCKDNDLNKIMFNKLSKKINIKISKNKINNFKSKLGKNCKIYELKQCCLQEISMYSYFIEYVKSKKIIEVDEFINKFKYYLKSYNKLHINGINYHDTINNACVLPLKYMYISKSAKIMRFDLENAYPTALLNIKMPYGKPTIFIGSEAMEFYNNFHKNNDNLLLIL